jgi:hypothetical protein
MFCLTGRRTENTWKIMPKQEKPLPEFSLTIGQVSKPNAKCRLQMEAEKLRGGLMNGERWLILNASAP